MNVEVDTSNALIQNSFLFYFSSCIKAKVGMIQVLIMKFMFR